MELGKVAGNTFNFSFKINNDITHKEITIFNSEKDGYLNKFIEIWMEGGAGRPESVTLDLSDVYRLRSLLSAVIDIAQNT